MTGAKSISALGVWRALLLFGVFGSVWLWHLSSVALSPPVDNIEQLVWMHSLEWGYYKHPPLPTWLVWVAVQMLGWSAWASYLLGASLTLASLAIFWHLLQAMRGAAYATVALLAAMCVTFYNGRLYYYNHNVALMLFIALSAWLCWRIVTRPNGWIWLALGIVGAMGLLSKYQMALAALCVVVVWARLGLWRQSGQRWGLVLALATTVLLFAPHAVWLLGHELGPIRYAEESSLGVSLGPWRRLGHTLLWLLDWAGNRCLPALIVLGVAWRAGRRGRGNIPPRQPGRGTRDPARTFLLTWGLLPALVMAVMGLTLGVDLQLQWGTAFALWTVPAAMELLRISPAQLLAANALRGVWWTFAGLQAVLLMLSWATSPSGIDRFKQAHWRSFPSQTLADGLGASARAALHGPIRIIVGPPAESGAAALRLPEHPLVLINGDLKISPWIKPADLDSGGVVELLRAGEPPPGAQPVMPGWAWRPLPSIHPGPGLDAAAASFRTPNARSPELPTLARSRTLLDTSSPGAGSAP